MPTRIHANSNSCTGAISRSTFEALLALRQQHNMAHGVSDLYAVCRLRAYGDTTITACSQEIAEARWMDLDE